MVMEAYHLQEDLVNGVMAQVPDHLILVRNEATGRVLCLTSTLVALTCLMAIHLGVPHHINSMVIHSILLATILYHTGGHRTSRDTAERL